MCDAPDCCKAKALAQRLHNANVRVFSYERRSAAARFGEVNISVYDHDPSE